ncbi:MAG: hypothetical protein IKZ58_01415 [Selenomonadaceae bacterium]|nr:hypothetical protein [Selenomonadaceae bacterium]
MKKILATMLLAFALVIVGSQSNQAEAYEQYVGRYSDGTAVYLLTETVNITQRNPHGYGFTCRVRAGGDYLSYRFWISGTTVNSRRTQYENSEGYSGYVHDGSSPVAASIYNYVWHNMGH